VKNVKAAGNLTDTVTFHLGTLGAIVTDRFSERIGEFGLKPKHVGLLVLLDAEGPASQQQLARALRVVPSLVVALADQLEDLGAVRRQRDPDDRRRQNLVLTAKGRTLLGRCTAIASAMDAELTAGLDPPAREALRRALVTLTAEHGFPAKGPASAG
jgi:DNA-binding MarR family transcriptional regulator